MWENNKLDVSWYLIAKLNIQYVHHQPCEYLKHTPIAHLQSQVFPSVAFWVEDLTVSEQGCGSADEVCLCPRIIVVGLRVFVFWVLEAVREDLCPELCH